MRKLVFLSLFSWGCAISCSVGCGSAPQTPTCLDAVHRLYLMPCALYLDNGVALSEREAVQQCQAWEEEAGRATEGSCSQRVAEWKQCLVTATGCKSCNGYLGKFQPVVGGPVEGCK